MLIDRIRSKVIGLLNTDLRGNFRNEDYNSFLHDAIQSRYEELFRDVAYYENMENAGRIRQFIQSQAAQTREKMNHYYKSAALAHDTDQTRTKPADLNYIDDIVIDASGQPFEQADNAREFNILKTSATIQYPIFHSGGTVINVSPDFDVTNAITIHYLRTPNIPKWTYDSVTGLFNPSAGDFVDADVHPSEEDELVRRVLMHFGVNLNAQEVVAYSVNEDNREFNQQNSV